MPLTPGAWQSLPASVLRACSRGGVVRALWVRGRSINEAETPNAVRDLACALGVTKPTRRHPGPEPDGCPADVLRALRVLKVDSAGDVSSALLTLPLCASLPVPPLLSSSSTSRWTTTNLCTPRAGALSSSRARTCPLYAC